MSYDIIGSIAILKPGKGNKKLANQILKMRPSVKSVLEKAEKIKGRLRTIKTKWLAGEKITETVYKENGCKFKVDVEKCYFSARLGSERAGVAGLIKKGENVLVLFGGVAPFAITIAKLSKAKKVLSVELGRECTKLAKENVNLNKLDERVGVVQGDVKKLDKLIKKQKFDVVVMPRPQLKQSFIEYAIPFCKKGTKIYYYDFGRQEELGKILERIKKDFGRKKYKVVGIKRAGEIAPYKFRFRIDLVVK